MRVSHFAKLEVIVPPEGYEAGEKSQAVLKTVGMAQNISIDDNFGSRAENTIGTPLPVLAPGYQQTTMRIEKATVDGADFRNLGAFNPLWAHVGKTYGADPRTGSIGINPQYAISEATSHGMYPFMFVLRVRNKISDSVAVSNINQDNTSGSNSGGLPAPGDRANSFGIYACVLQSASISATSNQAIIMDSINAIARPIDGTWLNEKVRDAFSDVSGLEDVKNGMATLVYDVLYGYIS